MEGAGQAHTMIAHKCESNGSLKKTEFCLNFGLADTTSSVAVSWPDLG